MSRPRGSAPESEDLQAIADDLRMLIQESHGVMKDLRREMKAAQGIIASLTRESCEKEIEKQMIILSRQVSEAMEQAVGLVFARFDQITDSLLGTDRESRRAGLPSLPEIIESRKSQ